MVSLICIGCGSGSDPQSESAASSKSSEKSSNEVVDSDSDSDSNSEMKTVQKESATVTETAKTSAQAVSGGVGNQSQIASSSSARSAAAGAGVEKTEVATAQSQSQDQSKGMGLFEKQPMPNEILKLILEDVKTLVSQGDFNAAFFKARSAANWKMNAEQLKILKEISLPITIGQEKLKNWQAKAEKPSEAALNKYSLQVGSEALEALEKIEI